VSHTYPVPGSEQAYPAARSPDLRVRVVPNESLAGQWPYLGELVQSLVDLGAPVGISVELDTSDRTRPGELRGGASPMAILAMVVLDGAAAAVAETLLNAGIVWVRRHLPAHPRAEDGVTVRIYGPNGEVLREVRVPDDD
jgi:hypothetical protein